MSNQASVAGKRAGQFIAYILIGAGLIIIGFIAIKIITDRKQSGDISVTPSRVNFPAPELTLNNLQGEVVSLSDYNGHILMVNNWATWCPPCRLEMPILAKYYNTHTAQGFMLLGIDAGDDASEVSKFIEDRKLPFPILLDPNNASMAAFHNDNLPSSYVIDRTGTVVLAWTGPINRDMLEKYVTPLLEQ